MKPADLLTASLTILALACATVAVGVEPAADSTTASPAPTQRIMVVIPEWHISHWIPDPAAETAIIGSLVDAGYRVIDQQTAGQVRANEQIRQRILGSPQSAAEIGLQYGADVIVTGEAFSEDAGRVSGMRSCRARVEIRAVRCQTAEIIAALSTEASGADISESVAAKKALRTAGKRAFDELEPRLQSAAARVSTRPIMVTVSAVGFEGFADVQSLISNIEGVESVVRPQHLGTTGTLEVLGQLGGLDVARSMSGAKVGGGRIVIEASSDERLSCAVVADPDGTTVEILGLTFDETAQVLGILRDRAGPHAAIVVEYTEEHSLFLVDPQVALMEMIEWLTEDTGAKLSLAVTSRGETQVTLESTEQ